MADTDDGAKAACVGAVREGYDRWAAVYDRDLGWPMLVMLALG